MIHLVWSGGNTYYATLLLNPQLKSAQKFEIKGLANDNRVHTLPEPLTIEGETHTRAVVRSVGVPV